MCRAYCHKIIKLSGTLQEFAPEKEVICNVHGVREKYLKIGTSGPNSKFTKGIAPILCIVFGACSVLFIINRNLFGCILFRGILYREDGMAKRIRRALQAHGLCEKTDKRLFSN